MRLRKMSSRRLHEDVLQLCHEDVSRPLGNVLEGKQCYTEDFFKESSLRRMFAGYQWMCPLLL